ncbi:MAG: PadR family transcriptional regulator, partial [Clostridia bacterium]|nr:PadR family transcriptional regulator [Clostridia bacterium]
MDTVNTELIRGHVDTIILNSLAERDRYGYEILDIISDLSEGRYEIKQPTLYSCLKRLEKQGFIDSYFGDESNGGRRRYYKLTEKGRETLEQDQREWEFSRTIINRLLSDKEIDLKTVEAPFDPNELRPLTRRVKAHDASEEIASAVAPTQAQEPIVKYVYIPQYIHVPQGNPLPESGVLPEGASFASEQEIPEEVRVSAPVVETTEEHATPVRAERSYFSFPFAQQDEEEITTPTEQEALDALYSSQTPKQQETAESVGEESARLNADDEENALIVKEQQTKASRLLGIGEFARPRNLLGDDGEEENASVISVSSEIQQNNNARQEQTSENINYREALSAFFGSATMTNSVEQASLAHQAEVERLENSAKARHFGDVKQSLYEDGFKLKVYQKANTINHYYMK